MPQGPGRESAEALATVRIVIAAASRMDRPFSVAAIAEDTGLTVEGVREVMEGPLYRDLLTGECRNLLSHAMTRGLRRMDDIVNAEKSSDRDRVSAFNAIVNTYGAVKPTKHDEQPPDIAAFLRDFGKKALPTP
jgi:hypothetical protein